MRKVWWRVVGDKKHKTDDGKVHTGLFPSTKRREEKRASRVRVAEKKSSHPQFHAVIGEIHCTLDCRRIFCPYAKVPFRCPCNSGFFLSVDFDLFVGLHV